jgi:ADP-heptose:LPS heptosyltransferase
MIPARDQTCFGSFTNLIDLAAVLTDFKSTASIIQQMDLVISVDTAVAHLAGALGKPTWTFIQHTPDWRWLLDRPTTPWYPTMRLFRQQQKAKWEPAISLVAPELNRLLGS